MQKLLILSILIVPSLLLAGHIPAVCHNELASWIKAGHAPAIVDVQDADGFRAQNYEHALAAGRDPVALKKIAARLRSTTGKVVVVSATGGDDTVQAVEQLVRGGVKRSRILLLEGGMLAAARNAACECCKPSALQGAAK